MSTAEKDPLDDLSSRLDTIEADLTTLAEQGHLDTGYDPDDRLDQLDRELRGLDAEEQFDVAFAEAFAEAFLFPPSPDFPACLWRQTSIHDVAAHAAAWVPGGEG